MHRHSGIAVVGAGISGLAAAHFLRRQMSACGLDGEIHLYEKTDRLGGVVQTVNRAGCLLESGPEAFLTLDPLLQDLLRDLGLAHRLVQPFLSATYLLKNGRLRPFLTSPGSFARHRLSTLQRHIPMGPVAKLRILAEPFISRSDGDPDLEAFFSRRLGADFWHEAVRPLLRTIYGDDCGQLSTAANLGHLHRLEQKWGSLWRGMRHQRPRDSATQGGLVTFKQGCAVLTERLAEDPLGETRVLKNCGNLRVVRLPEGGFRVRSQTNERNYEALVLAVPAPAAAPLLASVAPNVARTLAQIEYRGSCSVYLAYHSEDISPALKGTSLIMHPNEKSILRSCSLVNRKFPERCPEGLDLFRCSVGEHLVEEASDNRIVSEVTTELGKWVRRPTATVLEAVLRNPKSRPRLMPGHLARMQNAKAELASLGGIVLCSAYVQGAGIPECVRSARDAAAQVVQFLTQNKKNVRPPSHRSTELQISLMNVSRDKGFERND